MNAYYKGQPVIGVRGPSGPDGNPVGTVISFMGTAAPKDYLICDGATHNISDYPDLAAFFEAQFGTKNHFGGDGTTTFAVPDMRNLFLRGYHGEAEEQLSGEVGEKQDGTEIPGVVTGISNSAVGIYPMSRVSGSQAIKVQNQDRAVSTTPTYGVIAGHSTPVNDLTGNIASYTARPVNMAVLYCIKSVKSADLPGGSGGSSAGEVYSTEETVVGTWIDGRPVYSKTYYQEFDGQKNSEEVNIPFKTAGCDLLVKYNGFVYCEDNNGFGIGEYVSNGMKSNISFKTNGDIYMFLYMQTSTIQKYHVTLEYTKTTD